MDNNNITKQDNNVKHTGDLCMPPLAGSGGRIPVIKYIVDIYSVLIR